MASCKNGWTDFGNCFFVVFVISRTRFIRKTFLGKAIGKVVNLGVINTTMAIEVEIIIVKLIIFIIVLIWWR